MIIIIECYENFHLYVKFLLSSAYSRVQPNGKEDTMQTKRIIISLGRKNFYIAFHHFGHGSGYDVWYNGNVMMFDNIVFHVFEHGSNNVHDKKGVMSCFVR